MLPAEMLRDAASRQVEPEDETMDLKEKWPQIIDAVQDVVVVVDRNRMVVAANDAARKQAKGVDPSSIKTSCREFSRACGYTCHEQLGNCPVDTAIAQKKEVVVPLEQSSRETASEMSATPLLTEAGGVSHVVKVIRDVTGRTHAEKRIQQTRETEGLGVLAGGIAHDFNNLLLAIMGNADLVNQSLPPDTPCRENVDAILNSSHRAADLCKQMLAYSGKGRFVVRPVDLSPVVGDLVQLLRDTIPKSVVLRCDFAPKLPLINADVTQLRQVILNLLTNAAEAIGENIGVITVRTGAMECDEDYFKGAYSENDPVPGKYVYLEVADTGVGIDDQTRNRIFDPFFSTKALGRGLGLAALSGIVRGHDGVIKITSEMGRGTTFRILLPSSNGKVEQPQSSQPLNSDWQADGTVLIIDDEEPVRRIAGGILESVGFRVLSAADGMTGLKIYREHGNAINAVLLDVTMPNLSGAETYQELRTAGATMPVILSSGYNEQEAIERVGCEGLAGFIQKPYRAQQLLETVKHALD
ncbi:MAG: response regulator [Myxococcota bacterium]|nr:response regulator [Myxococcota bacterium]